MENRPRSAGQATTRLVTRLADGSIQDGVTGSILDVETLRNEVANGQRFRALSADTSRECTIQVLTELLRYIPGHPRPVPVTDMMRPVVDAGTLIAMRLKNHRLHVSTSQFGAANHQANDGDGKDPLKEDAAI